MLLEDLFYFVCELVGEWMARYLLISGRINNFFFSENDVSMNNLLKMQCKESLQWIHGITESFKYFLNFYGTLLVKPRQVENG